jgi:hypothetical protein
MTDILNDIDLTMAAYSAWNECCQRSVESFRDRGLRPEEIPEECAELGPDGTVLIYVDVPRVGRIEMTVPAGQWAWRGRN